MKRNSPKIKDAASRVATFVGLYKSLSITLNISRERRERFRENFDDSSPLANSALFLATAIIQAGLGARGYQSWSIIFLGPGASHISIWIMTVALAAFVFILTFLTGELISAAVSDDVLDWKTERLARKHGETEGQRIAKIQAKKQMWFGVGFGMILLGVIYFGLTTRLEIAATALETSQNSSRGGLTVEQLILPNNQADQASVEDSSFTTLYRQMSKWAIWIFLLALVAEVRFAVYLKTYVSYLFRTAIPYNIKSSQLETLYNSILRKDQWIDNMVRDELPKAELRLVANEYGYMVAIAVGRARFRDPSAPDTYLTDISELSEDQEHKVNGNGQSHDPAKDVLVMVETGNKV